MATSSDLLEHARAISQDNLRRNSFQSSSPSSRGSLSGNNSREISRPNSRNGSFCEPLLHAKGGYAGREDDVFRAGETQPHILSSFQKLAFSGGHILNDIAASLWFTYLLVYLETTKVGNKLFFSHTKTIKLTRNNRQNERKEKVYGWHQAR